GRSIECGDLEDPRIEPPEEVYAWTTSPAAAPDDPGNVTIHFEGGKPTSLQGKHMEFVDLIATLSELAGRHGVGRIDHVESRVVGIKSREVYECPAATVLVKAHQALEALVLPRDVLEFQRIVASRYAGLVYDGLWFTPLREALDAFVSSTQDRVTGDVSVKLFKGTATVVGRASPFSLYDHALATYSQGDRFRQSMAEGFIYVWGLPARTWAAAGARALASGRGGWREDPEDVHTSFEVALTERLGSLGAKLHTARSRNDQIALDERLFVREAIVSVRHGILGLELALLDLAEAHADAPMPGYTHLQRAQPVTVGHHLLAHVWPLIRDDLRLADGFGRANVSPLGAGALAGSTLPIDPAISARILGFAGPFENSIDAVGDRDHFVEFVFDLSLLAVHLSSIAEEIVVWASQEFGFLRPTQALGSGSSLMPQKRNPDVAELVRGKTGRFVGDLVSLLTTLKGLPLGYNRDLQED